VVVLIRCTVLCQSQRGGIAAEVYQCVMTARAILRHCQRVVVSEVHVQEVFPSAQLVYVHGVATVDVQEQRLVTGLLLVYGHEPLCVMYILLPACVLLRVVFTVVCCEEVIPAVGVTCVVENHEVGISV